MKTMNLQEENPFAKTGLLLNSDTKFVLFVTIRHVFSYYL
ncbi:hypothetical protein SAMN04487988_11246 [Algoriphagus hitonicola]|uniref:Uncharacterized protein n=1 Tax=Algoriphagus hitonicola TaxID=435880 RepID=A0A1I2WBE1_9BACT|nr:hypothetical protein SAMN04487988_11246 [Algoriphagus hitonicola]